MSTFVSGPHSSGFGSSQPGAGKKKDDGKKADEARKGEGAKKGKKKKSKGADANTKLLHKAAGLLSKAAERLSMGGGMGQMGQMGQMNPFGALGGLGLGGGYNAAQALGLSQGLGDGWAGFGGGAPQVATNGGTINNFNFNFGGGAGDNNPFAASFASSFGAPCPPQPQPPAQPGGFGAGAFSFAFA